MNNYLIPANSKRSQLIFNIFRPVDLIIACTGAALTGIFMLLISGDSIFMLVLKMLPLSIGLLLVMPVANYHNVLVWLREMILFMMSTKEYVWRGWCACIYGDSEKARKSSN